MGQQATPQSCPTWNAENLVWATKLNAEQAKHAASPSQKKALAKKGMEWGDTCVKAYPNEAECYFFRAEAREAYGLDAALIEGDRAQFRALQKQEMH